MLPKTRRHLRTGLNAKPKVRSHRCGFEALEARCLLSIDSSYLSRRAADVSLPLDESALHAPTVDKARPSQALDTVEFYWADGKRVDVDRVANEVGVAILPEAHAIVTTESVLESAGGLRNTTARPILDGLVVLRGPEGDSTWSYDTVADSLRKEEHVAWLTPIYKDKASKITLIPNGEVLIAVDEGFDVKEILGGDGTAIRPLRGTTDQFVVTLRADLAESSLAYANALETLPGVRWASPNFYSEGTKQTTIHCTPRSGR